MRSQKVVSSFEGLIQRILDTLSNENIQHKSLLQLVRKKIFRKYDISLKLVLIIDCEAREIKYLVASVRLSVSALTAEPFDL